MSVTPSCRSPICVVGYALLLFAPASSLRAARIDFMDSPLDEKRDPRSANETFVFETDSMYNVEVSADQVVTYLPGVLFAGCVLAYAMPTSVLPVTILFCMGALYASILGSLQVIFILGCVILLIFLCQLLELVFELTKDNTACSFLSSADSKASAGGGLAEGNFLKLFQGSPNCFIKFYQIAHAFPDFGAIVKDEKNNFSMALPGSSGKTVQLHVPSVKDVTRSSSSKTVHVDDLETWLHTQGVGKAWKFWMNMDMRTTRLATNIFSFAAVARKSRCPGSNMALGYMHELESLSAEEWDRVAPYVALFLHLDDDKDGRLTFQQAQPFLCGLLLPSKAFPATPAVQLTENETVSQASRDRHEQPQPSVAERRT